MRERNIDLVVLPSHPEGRFERRVLDHSRDELIRRMPCSLLLVRTEPSPASARPKDRLL